jgi:tagatose 6-phosphate kinase
VANPVGSGDCLLGGVAVALAREQSLEEALRLGVACGAANAMSRETGRFDRADVERLLPHVELSAL